MENKPPSFWESLGYAFATKVLGFVILLATGALVFLLILLWKKTHIEAIGIVAVLVVLLGLVAAIFVPKEIVARMAEDKSMSLSLAIAHTWYYYLLHLAFIPIVGPLIERFIDRKRRKNPFVVDAD